MKLFEAAKSVDTKSVYEEFTGNKIKAIFKKKSIAVKCPLHDDRSPSFNIYPNNTWYCFGCKKGGSNIDLVMELKGVDNATAAKMICDRFGIAYEDSYRKAPSADEAVSDEQEAKDRNDILSVNAKLKAAFHMYLPSAPNPKYYEERGVGSLVDEYSLGWCPEKPLFKPESIERCQQLGLCDSVGRSVFHGRYVLPIENGAGQTIGFIGRATPEMEAAGEPKYVISANSPAFRKRGAFFNSKGLYAEGGEILVVEGAFDALALIASGVKGVVSPLGNSLSDSHIRALQRVCHKDVVICFDDDEAGHLARDKALGYCKGLRLNVMTGDMMGCKDASELLVKHGAEAVAKAYSSFEDAPTFVIERAKAMFGDLSKNLKAQEALWLELAKIIGTSSAAHADKYPINPAYTPVAFNFYWKAFKEAIQ